MCEIPSTHNDEHKNSLTIVREHRGFRTRSTEEARVVLRGLRYHHVIRMR